MPRFDSSRLKIARARHHIRDLDRQFAAFTNECWRIVLKEHVETGLRFLFFEAAKPLPSTFAPIIGDVAHNLRSALDNMVWELVCPHNPPYPTKVQFPFSSTEEGFKKTIRERQIHLAGTKIVKKFHDLRPHGEGDDELARLHKLSIGDKHRTLATTITLTFLQNFDMQKIDPAAPSMKPYNNYGAAEFQNKSIYEYMPSDPRDRRAFENGAKIAANFVVLFGDKEPFAACAVTPTLEKLARKVEEVLYFFEK